MMEGWDRFMDDAPAIAFAILFVALLAVAVGLALLAAIAGITVFLAVGTALIAALIIAIVRLGTIGSTASYRAMARTVEAQREPPFVTLRSRAHHPPP